MNFVPHPLILEGEKVRLVPLEHEHFSELVRIAGNEKIWEFMSINGADPARITQHLRSAVLKRTTGEQYPFTVFDKEKGVIIGSTMLHNIYPEHLKVEIGWTWNDPAYWRTGTNRESKLLLLTACFETMKMIRVQFQTDMNNHRSRTAIEQLGASEEGILRNDRIRANGSYRNSVMYSIIADEWPDVKAKLVTSLKNPGK